MATEKFFVFNEDGALKRLKGRIVRFLDNEDPTGSDKSAIRTSLEVSPDAAGLVQADIGTQPNEIPVNGMLGDMAFQSSDGVSAAKIEVESTTGTATTQALTVTDGSSTKFVVQEDGKTGIGTASPSAKIHSEDTVTDNSSAEVARIQGTSSAGGTNTSLRFTAASSASNAANRWFGIQAYDHNPTARALALQHNGGNVGIGTSSPSHKLTVDSGDIQLQVPSSINTDVQSINWKNTNSSGFDIARIQAATGGNIYEGQIKFLTKDSGGTMATRWTINSSGNLVANGTAIDFGSAASGSGTPITNGGLLNDYESGTFTPTDGSGAGLSFTGAAGTYIKVGGQVTCWGILNYPTNSDATPAAVQGLPFPFGANNVDRVGGPVVYNNFGGYLSVLGVTSNSKVQIFKTTGSGPTNAQLSAQSIWFCVTYNVS